MGITKHKNSGTDNMYHTTTHKVLEILKLILPEVLRYSHFALIVEPFQQGKKKKKK